MKLKHYIIFTIILIIISSATAAGGFFYGSLVTKKKAEIDKEAAVKGAIYDAKEKLNEEAIEKAKEVIGDNVDKNSSDAKKVLEDFYSKIISSDYEGAYKLTSSDYKKTIYSSNALKKDYSNAKEIKVADIEFRSSGDTSALFAVTINKTLTSGTSKEDVYFVRLVKDISETWAIDGIELRDKNQNTSTKKSN